METTEFCQLTEDAIVDLLAGRVSESGKQEQDCRRTVPRWPFPGTVQLWISDEFGGEQQILATCLNLSLRGIGILCDEELEIGGEYALAIHQPEASFHGHGCVRHRTEIEDGYYIGLEFVFRKDEF